MIVLVIFTLAVSVHALGKYSDEFARNVMFPLSAAAYSDKPQLCVKNLFPNSTVYHQVTVKCDSKTESTCSGYTAVLHTQKAIVISFRSFSEGHNLEIAGARPDFTNSWRKQRKPCSLIGTVITLQVTGHSLGGSLASLAASFVVGSGFAKTKNTKLVTLGQPRTGDLVYAIGHHTQVEYSFRVVHWRDIVPHLPFGKEFGYRHHRQEVFYKRGMNSNEFVVCKGNEERECSNGLYFASSIQDHTHYFGKQVSAFGINGCV
ncbi:triacylglycerol lipase [Ancylostoma caninum]|uniref:Triacylglycerol lipase n=1 Tax=Ancylostoma caninum TaxID=29170 RepID=A0A368GCR9_ANCCA|nr:triacylglycerol lipase [Ancylostoma caninum]